MKNISSKQLLYTTYFSVFLLVFCMIIASYYYGMETGSYEERLSLWKFLRSFAVSYHLIVLVPLIYTSSKKVKHTLLWILSLGLTFSSFAIAGILVDLFLLVWLVLLKATNQDLSLHPLIQK